ncbi:carbon starvation protein A [Myxococcus llanfairpwllgwyngyllgogerychwyrndrobwllllantysiliogogogochensis]|uniref:Carbon starvation protein A n=1 Tax=Myxococcus llanfairpwllgwyngyllgogerychwyrndrobwllllantysiliogogogochensis TaxID=2590453 RepID=A0A540WXY0_9BACT|nr:carbon starvation CstA family protein [Myxococcus llanfairpwllgwyngyllgogerychwyrndrobwllllantysiliogogogochensis]TQF13858.1 carbon starvation protein A [Myxococcus llanfairpwllgwyngyllgogerychwyrndrobwllllantysiliogogogochensis]
MSLPLIAGVFLVVLALGYRFYGGFIARQFRLDGEAQTPAHAKNDGVDFVPTKPFYLLGQHFSAIAAAGPIAGPILAAQQFGWLPALLWIAVGAVFIGAMHDFATLVASVRHGAVSIAEVVRTHLGPTAGLAMLAFIWVALVYVIVAFTDATAATFVSGDAELEGLTFRFNPGGAVAFASIAYLALAVVMGLVDRYVKPPLWLQTLIFVPATLGVVYLGTRFSTLLVLDARGWAALILAYCFVASLTPVWVLLQPRGYLGGFVLYAALAVGVVGIFYGGLSGELSIQQPAFAGFNVPGAGGALFPFLFVTIACGACSGFHGLVCSGTTSKQIDKEPHCKPVGYGAMLLEGFVAVIALATVMIATKGELTGKAPGAVYGAGLGRFLVTVLGKEHLVFATTFGAMAFSTFVFDTLDVSTRLGRYILQELTGRKGRVSAMVATAVTCGVPLAFVLLAGTGAWRSFWTLFGTSNQLLASLSLLGVCVWLKSTSRPYVYALVPMLFVGAVTLTSLVLLVREALQPASSAVSRVNGVVAVVLLALALSLFTAGARALRSRRAPPATAPAV